MVDFNKVMENMKRDREFESKAKDMSLQDFIDFSFIHDNIESGGIRRIIAGQLFDRYYAEKIETVTSDKLENMVKISRMTNSEFLTLLLDVQREVELLDL